MVQMIEQVYQVTCTARPYGDSRSDACTACGTLSACLKKHVTLACLDSFAQTHTSCCRWLAILTRMATLQPSLTALAACTRCLEQTVGACAKRPSTRAQRQRAAHVMAVRGLSRYSPCLNRVTAPCIVVKPRALVTCIALSQWTSAGLNEASAHSMTAVASCTSLFQKVHAVSFGTVQCLYMQSESLLTDAGRATSVDTEWR